MAKKQRLHQRILSALGPAFQGMTLGTWWRLLKENGFKISPRYWFRALVTTFTCVPNTIDAFVERETYAEELAEVEIPPPIFLLGHWRSGTTHLHNLFCIDERYCYPNLYQVTNPHTFLRTEKIRAKLQDLVLPKTRGFDNVALSADTPYEDEFIGWHATTYSSYMAWSFPDNPRYDTYLTFAGADPADVEAWKASVVEFFRKLTFKYDGKPLILKSPQHTARVGLLLELFPEARFVHIHRNPYDVYRSTERLYESAAAMATFQPPHWDGMEDRIVRQYNEMFDAFFADKAKIPAGRFTEVGFNDLEADPVGELERMYGELELPSFADVKPRVEEYVASLAGYKKNVHADLEPRLKERLQTEWRRSFEAWGYEL